MSYLPLMLQQNSFDTICHEHLEYYSLSVLEIIMGKAGLRVFRTELNDVNGGSIRCYVGQAANQTLGTPETTAACSTCGRWNSRWSSIPTSLTSLSRTASSG